MPAPKQMRWYYSAIIDWMLANPGKPLSECAAHVHKSQAWLSTIINSDMFKAALAARKEAFQQQHDMLLLDRTAKVAAKSMDLILDVMEKKKDTVPIDVLAKIGDGALQRLGYGVKAAPAPVSVNVHQNNTTVAVPVTAEDLQAARMALRAAEQNRAAVRALPPLLEGPGLVEEVDDVAVSIPA